jgi:GWxTD domain-containing protein
MLGKRFTFLAFFATIFFQAQAKQLDATFDLAKFKVGKDQNMVELYCSVNGNSVIYKKVQGGFQASVALEVMFSDSEGIRHADKLMLKSPLVTDTARFLPAFNLQKRLFLKNGNYTFSAKMQDVNSQHPVSNLEMPFAVEFKEDAVQVSDIQLLESFEKTSVKNDYTKNGYKLMTYVSNFYPKGVDALKFYTEIYNTEAVLGKDKPLVVFYRVFPAKDNNSKISVAGQKIMKAAPVNVILNELDINSLASGNYELVVEVRNEENKVVGRQNRFFQRSNPQTDTEQFAALPVSELPAVFAAVDSTKLDFYLLSLKPIANGNEGVFVESVIKTASASQKRNYLYTFWQRQSAVNPEAAWVDYEKRINYVEKTFANQTFHGYETDLGRVYLQYGPPNKVMTELNDVNRPAQNRDTKPYQIWHYYTLGSQRNRIFAFIQQNLGNNNYSLVHSTANGEVSNNEWRTLATQKFNGDSRTDRNSGSRSFDNNGNEQHNPTQRMPTYK